MRRNRPICLGVLIASGLVLGSAFEGHVLAAPTSLSSTTTSPADDDLGLLRAKLERLEAVRLPLESERALFARDSRALASQIDQKKSESPSLRRDADLKQALAESKVKTDALSALAYKLRQNHQESLIVRKQIVRRTDELLSGRLPDARRAELERLRAIQVAMMATPESPIGQSLGRAALDPQLDPLDGPRELSEKADLLRDSEDKLRREMQRLGSRIDSVERKQRLRERAGAVDEDLFGESLSGRRIARAPGGSSSGGSMLAAANSGGGHGGSESAKSNSPAPPAATPAAGTTQSDTSTPSNPALSASGFSGSFSGQVNNDTLALGNLVDPATLAELKRADVGGNSDLQVRALKHAQGELATLAAELNRRAHALSARAEELKHKK